MSIIKNILLWIVVVFLFIIACVTNVVGIIFGLVAIVLIIPIKKWQEILVKFIRKPIKIIAIILAIILMFVSVSSVSEDPNKDISSGVVSSGELVESNISSENETTNESSEVSSIENNEDIESSEQAESSKPVQNSSKEEHTHNFVPATCIAPAKCSCGTTDGAAKGHTWKNATCNSAKTCSICGTTEGSALGHNYVDGKCIVCGDTDSNYTPPAANTTTYIININNNKFHKSICGFLPDEENREYTTKSREELIEENYEPCKKCNP